MYKQYCQELLDGVWELWRDIFKARGIGALSMLSRVTCDDLELQAERAEKAQEAAKLKMEQVPSTG